MSASCDDLHDLGILQRTSQDVVARSHSPYNCELNKPLFFINYLVFGVHL
jgi:hypothetical protein